MKILRWLFIKFWGFEDQRHIEDFIKWNHYYLVKRSIDKRLSMTQKIKKDKELLIKESDLDEALRFHLSGWFNEPDGIDRFKLELGFKRL